MTRPKAMAGQMDVFDITDPLEREPLTRLARQRPTSTRTSCARCWRSWTVTQVHAAIVTGAGDGPVITMSACFEHHRAVTQRLAQLLRTMSRSWAKAGVAIDHGRLWTTFEPDDLVVEVVERDDDGRVTVRPRSAWQRR